MPGGEFFHCLRQPPESNDGCRGERAGDSSPPPHAQRFSSGSHGPQAGTAQFGGRYFFGGFIGSQGDSMSRRPRGATKAPQVVRHAILPAVDQVEAASQARQPGSQEGQAAECHEVLRRAQRQSRIVSAAPALIASLLPGCKSRSDGARASATPAPSSRACRNPAREATSAPTARPPTERAGTLPWTSKCVGAATLAGWSCSDGATRGRVSCQGLAIRRCQLPAGSARRRGRAVPRCQ